MSALRRLGRAHAWPIGAAALAAAGGLLVLLGWGRGLARDASAQVGRPPEPAGITVIGEGLAKAQPDLTTIRLRVQSRAATPAAALSQLQESSRRLLQQLYHQGLPAMDIQTGALQVLPVYAPLRPGPSGEFAIDPTVIGYRGQATVVVQGQDVTRAERLLDVALQAGDTVVEEFRLGIRDASRLRRQGLTAAINDACPKAEAAAGAAGLTLAGIRSVQELSPELLPRLGGGGDSGVALGEFTVVVRAQVTFNVAR